MQIRCFPVTTSEDMRLCADIRRKVFVEGQNVPIEREADGLDDTARHFAVKLDDKIVATCRIRLIGSAAKIERMAVVPDCQNKGIGKILMKYVLQEVSKIEGLNLFKLSAQSYAVSFYEKLGFKTHGQEYMDADIPHYDMVLEKLEVAK